jgi:CRISPR type IV-associated protein Csf3
MVETPWLPHIDGLLAWVSVKRRIAEGPATEAELVAAAKALPLKQEGGVFCASQLWRVGSGDRFWSMLTRRTELDVLARDSSENGITTTNRDTFPSGTGHYKGFLIPVPHLTHKRLVGYAIGDVEMIRDHLRDITALGRQRRNSWGEIEGWEVEEVAETECEWWKRNLPEGHPAIQPGHTKALVNISSPYWDRSQRKAGYMWLH